MSELRYCVNILRSVAKNKPINLRKETFMPLDLYAQLKYCEQHELVLDEKQS